MEHIKVVIGANFGDEGKGMMTHFFSKNSEGRVLNVLYNGGCQRGHTVMNHVFHCFGSGYFDKADTYYHEKFMVDPIAWALECNQLNTVPNLFIHPKCRIVTPYDVVVNQAIEAQRGAHRHGSCGMGIWETDLRSRSHPIYYSDLYDELRLYNLLKVIKEEYFPSRLRRLNLQLNLDDISLDDFIVASHLMTIHAVNADTLSSHPLENNNYSTVIFEGGQGLLLDERYQQFTPHVTASSTGSKYIGNLISSLSYKNSCDVEVCYVSRSYMTRHGAGFLPYEVSKDKLNSCIEDKTNLPNLWQGSLRYGQINISHLLQRIQEDSHYYNVPIQKSVAFTHMNYSQGKVFTPDGLKDIDFIEVDKIYKFFNEFV